jgi:hypothetical protein
MAEDAAGLTQPQRVTDQAEPDTAAATLSSRDLRCSNLPYFIKAAPCRRRAARCSMPPQALARGVRPAGRSPRGARLQTLTEPLPSFST